MRIGLRATLYSFRDGVVVLGPMTEFERNIVSLFEQGFGHRAEELHAHTDGPEARVWWYCAPIGRHVLLAFGRAVHGHVYAEPLTGVAAVS
jgi:hypothetical protein